jgi:hypothetical protein
MQISIDTELVEKLSSKAVLAYVAVSMSDGTEVSTAVLAARVGCQTAAMLEGLKELSVAAPERVAKSGTKWRCGVVKVGEGEVVQSLSPEMERRIAFIDDLKKYYEFKNPGSLFTMIALDGVAVSKFLRLHKDWTQEMWRNALRNRGKSEVNHAQGLYAWIGKLAEYSASPLDRYGKPMVNGGSGGNGKAAIREHINRQGDEAYIASRM